MLTLSANIEILVHFGISLLLSMGFHILIAQSCCGFVSLLQPFD